MRHALKRLSLAAGLFAALASGCEALDRFRLRDPARGELPGGVTPVSYSVRVAEDGSGEPGPIPPARPRKVHPVRRHEPTNVPTPDRILVAAVQLGIEPADLPPPAASLERPGAPRAGIAPALLPGQLAFTHAANYSWLVGCLQYDIAHDVWSVCYADRGDPDRFGGQLALVNPGPMIGFQPGRLVRVEGELIDPAPLETRPAYRAHSIQVLRR
jgi:hypothetical protein